MVLYVSVVLLAELASLPSGERQDGSLRGPTGWALVALVWGTTIGLAAAHWFAFQLASKSFGGRADGHDVAIGLAQLVGAASVALLVSLVELLLPGRIHLQVVLFELAALIGVVGYLVARSSGRSVARALLFGAVALLAGLLAALLKNAFGYH
jgi:hypothetical protein